MTDTTDPVRRAHVLMSRQLVRMAAAYDEWEAGDLEGGQRYAEALMELLETSGHIGELLVQASEFAERQEATRV